MKGGARRKTITTDRPPSLPSPAPIQNEIDMHGDDEVEYNKQKREEEQMQSGDAGFEFDEDEDGDYEDYEDQFGDLEASAGVADGGDQKRPQLAEGYYEIEAVRKKRIRKGKTQYLIKWRSWPETANTWEPVENLMSCPDVIDAFEESLRSGKQRSNRKRKRKHTVASTQQSKKKQKPQPQQHSPAATNNVPSVRVKIIEQPEPLSLPSVLNSNFSNGAENPFGGRGNNGKNSSKANDNGSLKPNELKGTSFTNQGNMKEFAIHIQEDEAAGVKPANGVSKVDRREPIHASSHIGAKKRKSGVVKRFKPDPEKTTDADDVIGQHENQNVAPLVNRLDSDNMVDSSKSMCAIAKIIKPVDYSTSTVNGTEEVSVFFLVLRLDGKEIIVDNKFLKATHPLLLIDFYEQHLRYTTPPE